MTLQSKYRLDLIKHHKVIVGEGKSDSHFFDAFCAANNIQGFGYAFTGMHDEGHSPAGFTVFVRYLFALNSLAGFDQLTDLVLVCDSADNQQKRFHDLRKQISGANKKIGNNIYSEPERPNVISTKGMPRIHVLSIPIRGNGGLESVCFEVARDHQNAESDRGTRIENWVNTFADNLCKLDSREAR